MLLLRNEEYGGPNKGVLFLLSAASLIGFAYVRKQHIDRSRRLPGDVTIDPGSPLVANYELPETNELSGQQQYVELAVGERVAVHGVELKSTGIAWRATVTTEMARVLPPEREAPKNGPTGVTFYVQAMQTGGATVNFSLVNPKNEVTRTWTLTVTVT